MSRQEPGNIPPQIIDREKPGTCAQFRKYKLITPLFGGGEEPANPDTITIVRAPEIRGQLRFWWRATRGGEFSGDMDKMRRREEEIWGSSGEKGKPGPSDVVVRIIDWKKGTADHPFEVTSKRPGGPPSVKSRTGTTAPAYAAFPLQPEKDELKVGQDTPAVYNGVEFEMLIKYPIRLEQDIQAALWAWEIFGGLGARTRRGFGSIQLVELVVANEKKFVTSKTPAEMEAAVLKDLQKYVTEGPWPIAVPHLSPNMVMRVLQLSRPPIDTWVWLIDQLRSFRQKRNKNLGKSLWPEVYEIRRRNGKPQKLPDYKNVSIPKKFPRAAFGLPIIFHMPHDDKKSYTLQGKADKEKKYERLASALILKPLPCEGGGSVGLAAILVAPKNPPLGLEIKESLRLQDPISSELSSEEAKSSPLFEILKGQPDVLQAFLSSLKNQETTYYGR